MQKRTLKPIADAKFFNCLERDDDDDDDDGQR